MAILVAHNGRSQRACARLSRHARSRSVKPSRGYESLRHYRVTIPGASYFLTLCTHNRVAGLDSDAPAAAIRAEISALERDATFVVQAAVIMPDHLHLLGIVTDQLTVGQIVGRLKFKTRTALANAGVRWQGNFYEHRLKPDEPLEEVVRYLFLNPHRAHLLSPTEIYPWFWLGPTEAAWFRPTLDDDRPFPAWLAQPDTLTSASGKTPM